MKTQSSINRLGRLIGLVILSMLVAIGISLHPYSPLNIAKASIVVQPPLSTRGAAIVDTTGQPALLRGVNWFGIETELQVPHGLWARDYKEMLAQIRSQGYNFIRLPYSVQALRSSTISGVDYSIGSNQELEGKSPLEVMDLVIQEADRQGLMILLDSHRLNNERIPELWYGDGFTEDDWIETWKMLANRYRNQKNVIGADLKNEPHGRASWGTGDRATDWRLAAERAGNAILEINPDWLIVVEGVEKNVPRQRLQGHWWGGNLEGVKRYPVRLSHRNKLVYSPHEYGPGVINQPWFAEASFPRNLYNRWQIGFHYIAEEGIAPVLVGEFGGRQVDTNSKEGIWQRQFVGFLNQHSLSFAYWSWNPNSEDTGGLLLDNWQTVDAAKQQMLSPSLANLGYTSAPFTLPFRLPAPIGRAIDRQLPNLAPPRTNLAPPPSPYQQAQPSPQSSQPDPTTRTPQATPSPSPTPIANTTSSSVRNLQVQSRIQSDWQTGFCVSMQVTNSGNNQSGNWQLNFRMEDAAINNSWNGSFVPRGDRYVVLPPDWARSINPGQTVDLGFCANKLGPDYHPRQVSVTAG